MVTRACLRYAREGQNVTQAGPKCHTSRAEMSHKGQNVTQSCYNKRSSPEQNGRHFANYIFKCLFFNKNIIFWLEFFKSLFASVWLTIPQHWFIKWSAALTDYDPNHKHTRFRQFHWVIRWGSRYPLMSKDVDEWLNPLDIWWRKYLSMLRINSVDKMCQHDIWKIVEH